jgi:hypothetical protein
MQASRLRLGKPAGVPQSEVGIVIGEHLFEEGAREAGINLCDALRSDGVKVSLFRVPEELSSTSVLPKVFESFNSGRISEDCLAANLMYHNYASECLMWLKDLTDRNPGTVFYAMHNFVARFNGMQGRRSVGWGDSDFYGWVDVDKLRVKPYPSTREMNDFLPSLLRRLYGGKATRAEFDGAGCHISVCAGPEEYRYQTSDRMQLALKPVNQVPVTPVRISTVEIPGLLTHFKGQPTPRMSDEDLVRRFTLCPVLFGGEDDMFTAFGITREIRGVQAMNLLLEFYLMRWGVFDREVNRRAGLTEGHVVNPLKEFIKDDLSRRSKLAH